VRLRKYPDGWTRRHFLEQTAKGLMAAGVIAPLWDTIANTADCQAAYPPELLSLEAYTKGKLKAGQVLDASNVDIVKELLDPIAYWQIKFDGRLVDLVPTETDVRKLTFVPFLEATIRNRGVHHVAADGNVYTKDGKPWIGGNPFPEPKMPLELFYSNALSWGRHDAEADAMREWDTDAEGVTRYTYENYFVQTQTVGRVVLKPEPYLTGHEKQLRLMTTLVVAPQDVAGTGTFTVWDYDQRRFPTGYAYTPTTKRIRTFPPYERFDPMLPGSTMFISDAWMVGDPLLTWGDFKLVGKGPALACVSQGAFASNPDWEIPLCGGKSGNKYFRTRMELVPEAYVADLKPVRFKQCPYSRKRVWYDARTLNPMTMVGYDAAGNPLHQHETGYGTFVRKPGAPWKDSTPERFWAWTCLHAMDMKSGKMSRIQLVPATTGGYACMFDDARLFANYGSLDDLSRLGQ
jgi:hypothetical protein